MGRRWGPLALLVTAGCYEPGAPAPCAADEVPGPYMASFEGGVPPWAMTFEEPSATVRFEDGRMTVTPTSGGPGYAGINASSFDDVRGIRIRVEVPRMVNVATASQASLFFVDRNALFAELTQSYGQVVGKIVMADGTTQMASVTYDPREHRFWQIRESGGRLFFEISSDGGAWVSIAEATTPSWFQEARLTVDGGTYEDAAGEIGEVDFDNLVDCRTPPP